MTTQGRAIAFTVSPDQKVTSIVVGYNFAGCAGVSSFPNLSLEIGLPPAFPGVPRQPTPSSGPGFGFGSGAPDGPNYTQIYGSFTSSTSATGSIVFGTFQGCGNSGGIWTAAKR
jgi:hypothetical protein